MNDQILSLMQMPPIDATWQGAIVRFPSMVPNDPDAVGGCLWLDAANRRVKPGEPKPFAQLTAADLLDALVDFAREAQTGGARPTRIEVADEAIYTALRKNLHELHIEVTLVPSLKIVDVVTEGMQRMLESQFGEIERLENLPGMTESHLRGFAEAAKVFYEAKPWTHFDEFALLRIISPVVSKNLRHINLMGSAGEEFGIALFPSYRQFKRTIEAKDPVQFMAENPWWSVTFNDAENFPPGDLETWQRLALPICRQQMYPLPQYFTGGDEMEYPNAAQLRELELILRTVAALKKEDFEPRSRKHVFIGTVDGPQKVVIEAMYYHDALQDMKALRDLPHMLEMLAELGMTPPPKPPAANSSAAPRRKRSN